MAGRPVSRSLFKLIPGEEDKPCPDAPYELNDFKVHFLGIKDSTGYATAQDLFVHIPPIDRWREWQRVFKQGPLQRILEDWRQELQTIVRSEAERAIAGDCDPKDFPRLKFIVEGKLYTKRGAGRPIKGQIKKEEVHEENAKQQTQGNLDNV